MSGPPPIRIALWNDGGEALASSVEEEELRNVLRSFANLVSDAIGAVLVLPQFRHVDAVVVEDAAEDGPSSLSIGFDTSDGDVDLEQLKGVLDVAGLLLGTAPLPEELAKKAEAVITDGENGTTELQFKDEALAKTVTSVVKSAKLQRLYQDWFNANEEHLGEALDAASATIEPSETPLDPFDVLQAIIAQLASVAELSPLPPSLLSRGGRLLGSALAVPGTLLGKVTRRMKRVRRVWWRLEDLVVDGGKLAIKLGLKAARPVLVGLVLHRVLKTLDRSRSLEMRMARLPPAAAQELYCKEVLGPDWKEQLQGAWDKAVQDVNDGLVTDDINQEKRLVTAAQLRNLEVNEWDKQRMKNFYLSSFGGLQWFARMEEALHNPLVIESRGWTDPVQNWVGENRTYLGDLPQGGYMSDVGRVALQYKEAELGRRLTAEEEARVLRRGAEVAGGLLPTSTKGLGAAALAAGGALVPAAPRP